MPKSHLPAALQPAYLPRGLGKPNGAHVASSAGDKRSASASRTMRPSMSGYPVDTADLIERNGAWWLHVVVTLPAPDVQPTDQVVGVDLGIHARRSRRTTASWAERWKAIEGRYFNIRALQKKGTKSAKRHLRKLKRRSARFRQDSDHVLSKQIVQAASRARRSCWKTSRTSASA